MALKESSARLLCWLKKTTDIKLDSLLTLGKLRLYMKSKQIESLYKDYSDVLQEKEINNSDTLFKSLGVQTLCSLDFSDFEGADIIHDLNLPIKSHLKERFDCVIDAGTSEHVFNVYQNILNIMSMIKKGGYYIGTLPTNNYSGHGLYQFSAGLFIQLFNQNNNFQLIHIFYCHRRNTKRLYKIIDSAFKDRFEINDYMPAEIYVVAKKTGSTPGTLTLQQKDYEAKWNKTFSPPSLKKGLLWKAYDKIYMRLSFEYREGFFRVFEKNMINRKYLKKIEI